MRRHSAIVLLATMIAAASGGACGMARSTSDSAKCSVIGADKALAEAGGPAALCAAIAEEAQRKAPGADYRIEIRAISDHSLGATIRLDGRALAEQRLAVMDRKISHAMVKRFASDLADLIATESRGGRQ